MNRLQLRLSWGLLLVVVALAGGCTKAGRSVVNLDVSAPPTIVGLQSIKLTVTKNGDPVHSANVLWNAAGLKLGLYLPASVSGSVNVEATGFSTAAPGAPGDAIAHSDPLPVMVTPGEATKLLPLMLKAGPPPSGNTDGGIEAGAGSGGVSGSGGANNGGTGGSGGAVATGGRGTGGGSATGGATGGGTAGSGSGGRVDAGAGGTPGRNWSAPEMVEDDRTGFDEFPKVAMNASGTGVAAWQRGVAVWARFYDGGTQSWATARMITPTAAYGNFEVGIDDAGNAMIVWAGDGGTPDQGVWWSRSTNGGVGWSIPKRIGMGRASLPSLAVGPNGTALAAWTENPGNNLFTVVSSDFRGVDWNTNLNTPQPGVDQGDRNPRVAVDGMGRGFLVWQNGTATQTFSSIFVQRYDTTWSAPSVMMLESYNGGWAASPAVALNESGVGMATWLQLGAANTEIWGRRFDGTAWGVAAVISMGSIESDPIPEVAVDPAGVALSIWSQGLPTNYNTRAARHAANATPAWDAPLGLETNNMLGPLVTDYGAPLVRLDRDGNAFAIWRKKVSSTRIVIYSSRLAANATAWAPANGMPLHDDGMHSVGNIDLAVSRNGTAIAVWDYDIEHDIWGSVFR